MFIAWFCKSFLIDGEDTGDFFDTYAAAFIPDTETNRTVYISVCDDDLPEADETFTFYLTLPKPSARIKLGSPKSVTVTILSNDNAFGIISFNMIEDGPNPAEEDLSPARGNITFTPGRSVLIYNLTVLDDQLMMVAHPQRNRFDGITIVRNGGTHGNISVTWVIIRNSSDPSPVTADLVPETGEICFDQGEMLVTIPLNIIDDDLPEEAEPYILKLLAHTIQGGAEVSEPSELEKVELVNRIPLIPPVSPRLGEIRNISLKITPDIANGEIGFISNLPIILSEPEDSPATVVPIALHRDGTDGQATVFWSLKPSGLNQKAVTHDDISPFNGSVVFLSGQSDTSINITIKADDTPEMNETVLLTLDRVSVENQILKYGFTTREIVILENDDPGGVFEFSPSSRGPYSIKEGESVELQIVRSRGSLVRQFLRYTVEPRDNNEFYGSTGILEFKPEPLTVSVTEGSVANFTVIRNGSADAAVAVQYITVNGDATAEEGDFVPSGKSSVILFDVGEREQNLSVYTNDDDTPETDEAFYIFLLNSTGKSNGFMYF
ncbi:hypothetical protein llap_16518 [Limosa lapponica baueri]|uniref:Calx-beta domain-containing protein n=1 Tax=Limosa lapponica baueri TaxID=1758121 RepID=A0A2I0TH98_LIMLA|nr:hypothetical protein llap_16518 [Limosa lapponica baueri]